MKTAPIPGFPDYAATDDGMIISYKRLFEGYALRAGLGGTKGKQYRSVVLSNNGEPKTKRVSRLVLEAFCGPCPEGRQACHNDGDRENNKLSNLRWDTPKNNCADRIRHGTAARGERHGKAKLTTNDVRKIRLSFEQGKDCCWLASQYGVTSPAIYKIINRVNWYWI